MLRPVSETSSGGFALENCRMGHLSLIRLAASVTETSRFASGPRDRRRIGGPSARRLAQIVMAAIYDPVLWVRSCSETSKCSTDPVVHRSRGP